MRVTVYRFRRVVRDRVLSPAHMWGTREAIARLPDATIVEEGAREVDAGRLENGFFFETDAPRAADVHIDTAPTTPWK